MVCFSHIDMCVCMHADTSICACLFFFFLIQGSVFISSSKYLRMQNVSHRSKEVEKLSPLIHACHSDGIRLRGSKYFVKGLITD